MENHKNCSNKKHSDINAINYCIDCNLQLCNKCTNLHSELLDNHHVYNLDKKIEDIFTGTCKEPNHKNKLIYGMTSSNIVIYYIVLLVLVKLIKRAWTAF